MTDSVTTIAQEFVVVQDTQPSSPFEGQIWLDTSSDVTKQWNGSTWKSVQSSVDGSTITKNGSGQLQVPIDSTTVRLDTNGNIIAVGQENTLIGDFENDIGSWTVNGTMSRTGDITDANGTQTYQSGSWFVGAYDFESNGNNELKRTMDLSGKETLVFYYFVDHHTETSRNVSGEATLEIGGNTEHVIDLDTATREQWIEVQIDISAYSGSQQIRFYESQSSGGSAYWNFGVDEIRLKKAGIDILDNSNGEGGAA